MSAEDFLASALDSTMPALAGESFLVVDSKSVPCVVDPISETEDLIHGGDGDQRSVTVLCASGDLPTPPPSKGDQVQYLSADWTINTIDYHPTTTTRLFLHSPARRTS